MHCPKRKNQVLSEFLAVHRLTLIAIKQLVQDVSYADIFKLKLNIFL